MIPRYRLGASLCRTSSRAAKALFVCSSWPRRASSSMSRTSGEGTGVFLGASSDILSSFFHRNSRVTGMSYLRPMAEMLPQAFRPSVRITRFWSSERRRRRPGITGGMANFSRCSWSGVMPSYLPWRALEFRPSRCSLRVSLYLGLKVRRSLVPPWVLAGTLRGYRPRFPVTVIRLSLQVRRAPKRVCKCFDTLF